MNLAHIGTYEKLGLFALGMVIFVVVAPKAMAFFMGSVASIATLSQPTIPGAPAEPRRPERRFAGSSTATDIGFGRDAVESAGGDWHAASAINANLVRLQQRRRPSIVRDGDTPHAKITWKIAVSSQAALYRLVALADAATTLWNFRNPLGAIVTATSLLENTAAFVAFEQTLTQLTTTGDLSALDAYVTQAGFPNPLEGETGPSAAKSPAGITLLPPAAQSAHAQLAAMADRPALTQYRLFGTLDKTSISVAFSDSESFDKAVLDQLMVAVGTLKAVEIHLATIDALLEKIAAQVSN